MNPLLLQALDTCYKLPPEAWKSPEYKEFTRVSAVFAVIGVYSAPACSADAHEGKNQGQIRDENQYNLGTARIAVMCDHFFNSTFDALHTLVIALGADFANRRQ